MIAAQAAASGYNAYSNIVKSDRAIEYDAFSSVTVDLKKFEGSTKPTPKMIAALDRNRRLWLLLATDVASSENKLPNDLRAQIFYLSEFVTAHSRQVLHGNETLGPLVEVNTAIMRGLQSMGAA